MVAVTVEILLRCGADVLALVKFADGFGALLCRPEYRISCFALPVSQGKLNTVRQAHGRVGVPRRPTKNRDFKPIFIGCAQR